MGKVGQTANDSGPESNICHMSSREKSSHKWGLADTILPPRCGHGGQGQVCVLRWRVLSRRFWGRGLLCSLSAPFLSLPHWASEHWRFTGLHFTNRTRYFTLKTGLKASHTFSFPWESSQGGWLCFPALWVWQRAPPLSTESGEVRLLAHCPLLHSPEKGPLLGSQVRQLPTPSAQLHRSLINIPPQPQPPGERRGNYTQVSIWPIKIRTLDQFGICKWFWVTFQGEKGPL